MKLLLELDQKNYDLAWPGEIREAVRAIVCRGEKLALVRSGAEGWYKFPGGGIEEGESHVEALLRETRGETGLVLLPESLRPFGMTKERRRAHRGKEMWFEHRSYFYIAQAQEQLTEQHLEADEAELEFTLAWVEAREAYEVNRRILEQPGSGPFLLRATRVLEQLSELDARDLYAAEPF